MLQSTKTFETKLVRYIEWSNVQPWVHHFSPIWPHYGHFGPKNSHIWPYLAIGSPSCPKLVEHWLNMVEHRSPHLGWATWTPLHSPKWPVKKSSPLPLWGHRLPVKALALSARRPLGLDKLHCKKILCSYCLSCLWCFAMNEKYIDHSIIYLYSLSPLSQLSFLHTCLGYSVVDGH